MGIFSNLFGGEDVAKPVEAVGNVLDQLFTSDEERLTKIEALERLKQQPQLAQVELNKIEAAHRSIFVAGWRPFIGWICGVCLGAYFLPQFILAAILWVNMCLEQSQLLPYPVDGKQLSELVYALLGLGVLRSFEKLKGLAK